jgi:hypothetical protein|tara:strand:- start:51 stop:356 length:306 start_codon:yes stop_codon:yes gene_type:complete
MKEIFTERDTKLARIGKRYKGLSRVCASINDLYIYGITSQNFPHLMEVLENAKDHVKEQIRDCKYEIAVESGLEVKALPPTDPLKQEKKIVDVEELYKGGL